jgi:hypothetical protein
MSSKSRKRGRPPGISQYAPGDERALVRMYELVVSKRQPVAAAARAVVAEMKVPGSDPVERLRQKFRRKRAQIAARVEAKSRPQAPPAKSAIPSDIVQNARDVAAFLKTPQGRDAIENARWVAKNKRSILEAAALVRSTKR